MAMSSDSPEDADRGSSPRAERQHDQAMGRFGDDPGGPDGGEASPDPEGGSHPHGHGTRGRSGKAVEGRRGPVGRAARLRRGELRQALSALEGRQGAPGEAPDPVDLQLGLWRGRHWPTR